jgi:ABC-type transport system involved in multi-copper enzyme maturation permease subunit
MRNIRAIAALLIKEIFRKKDFYVALILMVVILFYASSLQFYNVKNIVRYLMEIGLGLIFVLSVILTTALAARQFPAETAQRTCQVILAKPVSRLQFVLGKFLGSFLAGSACFTIYYFLFLALVWQKAGSVSWVLAGQAFYLFILNLLVLAAMASGLSYYLTTSANVTATIIVWVLMNVYGAVLREASRGLFWLNRALGEAFYFALPHFEFFDLRQRFIHDWEALPGWLCGVLTVYAAFYAMFFIFLGWWKFRKQCLS